MDFIGTAPDKALFVVMAAVEMLVQALVLAEGAAGAAAAVLAVYHQP